MIGSSGSSERDPLLLKFGLAAALVGLLCVHTRLLWDTGGLPKMLFFSGGVLAAWAALIWRGRLSYLPAGARSLDAAAAAFMASLALSTALSMERSLSWAGLYGDYFYGVFPLTLCLGVYYCAAGAREESTRDFWKTAALAAGAADALYCLAQQVWFRDELLAGGRSTGSLANPVFMSSMVVALLPAALDEALTRAGARRALAAAAFILGLCALWVGGARSGLLGTAVGLAAYFYFSRSGGVSLRTGAKILSAAAILGAAVFWLAARHSFRTSDAMRLQIWDTSAAICMLNPLTGAGPETFPLLFAKYRTLDYLRAAQDYRLVMDYAHNDLLQVTATMGLLGMAAYLWLAWAALKLVARSLTSAARRSRAAAAAAALLGVFVVAKVNPVPAAALAACALWLGLLVGELPPEAAPRASAGRRLAERATAVAALALFVSAGLSYSRRATADFAFRRALDDHRQGDVNGAVAQFNRALTLSPREPKYYEGYDRLLVDCLTHAPQPQQLACLQRSVELGRQAVAQLPNNFYSYQLLATAWGRVSTLTGEDHWSEADQLFQKALALNPGWLPLYRGRREIALARKDQKTLSEVSAQFQPYYDIFKRPDGSVDW